jgi:histidyl-tRNA synthetase
VGFDRILLAIEKEGQTYKNEGITAYVLPVSEDVKMDACTIAAKLRSAGIPTDIEIMGRKMGKAMKYASGLDVKYAVIVGAQELEQDSVTVRDMESGEQKLVKIDSLADELR